MGLHHREDHDLAKFLRENTSAIIDQWVEITRPRLSSPPLRQLSYEEFRDDAPEALESLATFLERRRTLSEPSQLKEMAGQHGRQRWRQDFNLGDLIRDWGNLHRVVLEWVNRFYEDGEAKESMDRSTATDGVIAFFTEAACGSVARFDELRRDDATRMAAELQRMRHHFVRIEDLRNRLLTDFSHNLRSPLTAITGASSILESEENAEDGKDHDGSHELRAIIEESVADAMELLDALRQLSHIDAGLAELLPSSIDVVALLREVLNEWRAKAGSAAEGGAISISGPGRLEAEADADKLRKTFENLFSNQGADGKAEPAPVEGIVVRPMEDGWELQVRYARRDSGKPSEGEGTRGDIDALILRRLCLIQLASFQSAEVPGGGQIITLRFPLDYRDTE